MEKKQKKMVILRIGMAICAVGILFLALMLLRMQQAYGAGVDEYERIADDFAPVSANADAGESGKVAIDRLQEQMKGSVGWICGADSINYPIMQGHDNEYYLKHLPDGTPNIAGSVFIDYRNSGNFTDKNTVIYGHRMRNNTMFSAVDSYREQAFYDEHPEMYVYTAQCTYKVEIFCVNVVKGEGTTIPLAFQEGTFMDYIVEIQEANMLQTDVRVSEYDRIVTLVTCSPSFENARTILYGKLVLVG